MKDFLIIRFLLFSLIGLTATNSALAVSGNTNVRINCPDIGSKTETLTNFGAYISGTGIERVGVNAPIFPIFMGAVMPGANIPSNLKQAGYHHGGTSYSANSGLISCHYVSLLGFNAFDVGYTMKNGFGGIVTKSSTEEINLMLTVGNKV